MNACSASATCKRQVVVGIGSNTRRDHHIRICLDALQARFTDLKVSRVFESEPLGYQAGGNFYNLVAVFSSTATVRELRDWSKCLEQRHGRDPNAPRFRPQRLDIDLLTIGDLTGTIEGVTLPREEIIRNAYVLWPLAELLPEDRHPSLGERYADLWAGFDRDSQRLWPVDFVWRGERISHADGAGQTAE
ncbi:2-amino-4-hydroxy-6-hydroxymethyldihydropteridine diphosphokinase [Halomonas shantousis]